MRRRSYYISALPLMPLVAPTSFDPSAQTVNIYSIFKDEASEEKAYIYLFSDTVNTLTLATGTGLYYKYGYTLAGTDYTFTTTGIVNPFSAGMTKRWVMGFGASIILNPFQAVSNGIIWVYMHRVTDWRLGNKNVLKYVHTSDLTTIIPTLNQNPYALNINTGLIGVLTIPSFYSIIPAQFLNTSGSGITGTLTIPPSVTYIYNYAFQQCTGFTSLSLNDNITSIEIGAFSDMSNLVVNNLTFSSSLTFLGDTVFRNNVKFTGNVTIPQSCTAIGKTCFQGLTGATGVFSFGTNVVAGGMQAVISNSNLTFASHDSTNYQVVDNVLYGKTAGVIRTLLSAPKTKTGTLTIPSTVTRISENACLYGQISGDLLLPDGLETIEGIAFRYCTGLNGTLTIPSSITSLLTNAFRDMGNNLTALNLKSGYNPVQANDNWKFDFCTNFSAISLNQSILNIAGGGSTTRTITIGATNKARLLAAYPTAETDANARGITIV